MLIRSLLATALLGLSFTAQAAVLISIQQVDGDVVLTATGSINTLNGLTNAQEASAPGTLLFPDYGLIASQFFSGTLFHVASAPADFGTGGVVFPSVISSSGAPFAVTGTDTLANPGTITLPADYELGSPIAFSLRMGTNSTLEKLGIRTGTYRWTWGTPGDNDYVVLFAGVPPILPTAGAPATTTPVPALSDWSLLGLAAAIGATALARRRRRHLNRSSLLH